MGKEPGIYRGSDKISFYIYEEAGNPGWVCDIATGEVKIVYRGYPCLTRSKKIDPPSN